MVSVGGFPDHLQNPFQVVLVVNVCDVGTTVFEMFVKAAV